MVKTNWTEHLNKYLKNKLQIIQSLGNIRSFNGEDQKC